MAAAGLAVHGLFAAADLVPAPPFHGDFVHNTISWNYTTFLNIAFIVVFGVLVWLSRQGGASERYAIDPICGMQVAEGERSCAPSHRRRGLLVLLRPVR